MSMIHDLREDYYHYRKMNPQYRLLFILVDVVSFFLKLALFGGFILLCWYLMERGAPRPEFIPANGLVVEEQEPVTPELTDERIELLNTIAGKQDDEPVVTESAIEVVSSAPAEVVASTGPVVVSQSVALGQPVTRDVVALAETITVTPVYITEQPTVIEPTIIEASYVRSVESTDWIFNQPSDDYTLQIAMTVNRPFLLRFVEKLPAYLTSAIYPARINSNGELQYSLSVGRFSDEQQAEEALAQLSTSSKRYGAHVKQFGEIQRNVSVF